MAEKTNARLYAGKPSGYYRGRNKVLVQLLPDGAGRVLDIGCGQGGLLRDARGLGKAREIHGVDLYVDQPPTDMDSFHLLNVEREDLPYPPAHFETIVMADVLEHLVDPWAVLPKVRELLAPGGVLVVSLPNIRELWTLWSIVVRRDFHYTDYGILDRTHLRFFCLRNMRELLEGAGFSVERVMPYRDNNQRWSNRFTLGLLSELFATQYFLVARRI